MMLSPATEDIAAYRRSLSELSKLPIDRILVAHGQPVLSNGNDRIREALLRFDG